MEDPATQESRKHIGKFEWLWRQYPAIKSMELTERRRVNKYNGGFDHILFFVINGQDYSQSENGLLEAAIGGTLEREVAHKVSGFLRKDLDEIAPKFFDQAADREQRRYQKMVQQAGYQDAELVPLHTLPEEIAKEITMQPGAPGDIKSQRPKQVLEVQTSETRTKRRGRPKGSRNRPKVATKSDS